MDQAGFELKFELLYDDVEELIEYLKSKGLDNQVELIEKQVKEQMNMDWKEVESGSN